jgi:hypothetical protein
MTDKALLPNADAVDQDRVVVQADVGADRGTIRKVSILADFQDWQIPQPGIRINHKRSRWPLIPKEP